MRPTRRCAVAVRLLAALATATALTLPAAAQVNTESMRVGAEEPGWASTIDLSSSLQRGNTEREVLGAGARVQYAWMHAEGTSDPGEVESTDGEEAPDRPTSVVFLTSNYSFTRLNDNRFVNNALSHLRFIREHSARFSYEVFGQHQFNEFTRLEQRLLFGGGGRFQVLEAPRAEVFLGTGYMLERETLDLPAELSDARRSEHHRSTNYLTVRYNSRDERLRLVETLYFQTRFDRVEDYRVLSETSFEIQLLRRLALAINLNVAHDSEPPTGVKETDVVLSNSLRYSF
ncbi:MAG: DUF481 domain-containing protein [Holophagales bacterium]|nr:DUF481 domain-containing protein [Holophagales bacterium]MYG29630.1 DUF481 domain-containing protein [Holophagales bacterium]MYI79852.1 DUF481 domain-containing protein [Holophagales bacterium]